MNFSGKVQVLNFCGIFARGTSVEGGGGHKKHVNSRLFDVKVNER